MREVAIPDADCKVELFIHDLGGQEMYKELCSQYVCPLSEKVGVFFSFFPSLLFPPHPLLTNNTVSWNKRDDARV